MDKGDILLLENLRFHQAEELNNPEFSNHLASLGDFYVNDAFSTLIENMPQLTAPLRFLISEQLG